MSTRAASLAEAIAIHKNRVFQDYVAALVEIYKGTDRAWDLRLAAWERAMKETPYLEDRDKTLLTDLKNTLFEVPA